MPELLLLVFLLAVAGWAVDYGVSAVKALWGRPKPVPEREGRVSSALAAHRAAMVLVNEARRSKPPPPPAPPSRFRKLVTEPCSIEVNMRYEPDALQKLMSAGIITPNEVRAYYGYPGMDTRVAAVLPATITTMKAVGGTVTFGRPAPDQREQR